MLKRKTRLTLCVFVALAMLLSFVPASMAADTRIDTTRITSLTLHYKSDKTTFSKVQFKLYRVADVSVGGEFTATDEFAKYKPSFTGLTNDGWTDLAGTLASYVSRDKLRALATVITDNDGKAVYENLTTGLYLVVGGKHTYGRYTYTPQPFLVSLPSLNPDGLWDYDVVSEPKPVGSSNPPKPGGDPGGDPGDPVEPTEVDITATKIWKGVTGDHKPSNSIIAQLLRNGAVYSEVTLSDDNNWTYTWHNLDGSYSWAVVEKFIPDGFTVSIGQDGEVFRITNTADPDRKPNDPDDPDDPDNPNKPNDPDDPDKPNKPNDPDDPDNPDNPNKPNDPDNPDKPNKPNDPDNPDNPDNPDKPNEPDRPNKPNNPDKPNKPNDPDNPDEPPTLPQTGMLWWPVPVMYTLGSGIFFAGYRTRRKDESSDEDNKDEAE